MLFSEGSSGKEVSYKEKSGSELYGNLFTLQNFRFKIHERYKIRLNHHWK